MANAITFGTDGWRAVIADDFTLENLGRVALATGNYLKKSKKIKNGIVVGYDARFMSREFAEHTAYILGNAGIRVRLADSIVSTPMISLVTKLENAAGGIVITASHNPPRYNGFKIKGDFGGPAHPEMIAKVEKELAKVLKKKKLAPGKRTLTQLLDKRIVSYVSMKKTYLDHVAARIDLEKIRKSGLKVLYDVMYGAGQRVLDEVLPEIRQMHNVHNPGFGGTNPEPLAKNLRELMKGTREGGYDIGIATDGDADRIGAVDEQGRFVDSQRIFALLLKYLVEQKGMRGDVAKSFSVTQLVDKQCARYGLTMHETPIGFKHICRLMTERDVLIGGEESGGLGVMGHIPERDGIYLGLLLIEMMATRKKSLSALVQELMDDYGNHEFQRIDAHMTEKEKVAIMKKYKKGVKEIGRYPVIGRKDIDGHKFFVKGGWVLVRASGTEPLVRFYAEGESAEMVDALLAAAMKK